MGYEQFWCQLYTHTHMHTPMHTPMHTCTHGSTRARRSTIKVQKHCIMADVSEIDCAQIKSFHISNMWIASDWNKYWSKPESISYKHIKNRQLSDYKNIQYIKILSNVNGDLAYVFSVILSSCFLILSALFHFCSSIYRAVLRIKGQSLCWKGHVLGAKKAWSRKFSGY